MSCAAVGPYIPVVWLLGTPHGTSTMPSEIVPHSTYTIRQNRTKIAAGPLERLGIQAHRHGQSTIEPLVSRRAVRVTNGAGIRTKPKDGPVMQDLGADFDGSGFSYLPTYIYLLLWLSSRYV